MSKTLLLALSILALVNMLVAACTTTTATPPPPIVQTVIVTVQEEDTFITQIAPPTLAPTEPPEPRSLTICVAHEPANLFIYGESSGKNKHNILAAIYDGPIDHVSYQYQPVILTRIPSLADGDALLRPVAVNPGDPIVDSEGNIASLKNGVKVRPAGCENADCLVEYTENEGAVMLEQMEVTFQLLPGLLWSDGAPLTADDSVFSFNLASSPEIPANRDIIDRTTSYQALDRLSVRWIGLPGYRDVTYFANFWSPLPKHILGQFPASELFSVEAAARVPIGWGPYQIEDWVPGSHIQLSRNKNYFRAKEGLPRFDDLIYRFVGDDPAKTIPMLLSGECDILEETAQLFEQSELLLAMQDQGQISVLFAPKSAWEHVDFGIAPVSYDDGWTVADDRPHFFKDVRTRQAMAYCMDRQRVAETVMFGQSVVLDTYLPPQHPLFNPDIEQYTFDPAKGAALLEEVGWMDDDSDPATPRTYAGDDPQIPTGTSLSFHFSTSTTPHRQQAIQLLAQSMAECGIQANLQLWSIGEYFTDGPDGPIFGRRFDIGQFAWLIDVQPLCELYLTDWIPGNPGTTNPYSGKPFLSWKATNVSGFSNTDYDSVCQAAMASLPDQPGYAENHLRAQEIFSAQLPAVPLYLQMKVAAARVDLCNFIVDPTISSEFFNIEAFDYGESCGG